MKIRYRLYDGSGALPMHGDHMMSRRGRGGYLILGVEDRGKRGGLGAPTYRQLLLTVERVSRAECEAAARLWTIKWDRRRRRMAT